MALIGSSLELMTKKLSALKIYALGRNSHIDKELEAYQAGFALLEELLEATLKQAFVHTATGEDLARHEKLVGLAPRYGMATASRRELVLYRLGVAPMDFHPAGMLSSIRAAGMEAEITENVPGESIKVRCVEMLDTVADLDRLKTSVVAMLPAHLEMEFDIGELTWDQIDAKGRNWDVLDATNITWTDFDIDGHNLLA